MVARELSQEFLSVGAGHELYIEREGIRGHPEVLFLHGGPGASFSDKDKTFFPRDRVRLTLFDQRGCGRSKFKNRLASNTTNDLVDDIERILDHYDIEKINIFGGSWGATLGLTFAIRHPQRVSSLVLRGLFLADDQAFDHFVNAAKTVLPGVSERFASLYPATKTLRDLASCYFEDMTVSGENAPRAKRAKDEWARYELSIGSRTYDPQLVEAILKSVDLTAFSILGAYYFSQSFFLETTNINRMMDRIRHLPITLVHGTNDWVAPISQAREIANRYSNVALIETAGGHSAFDEENLSSLISVASKVYC